VLFHSKPLVPGLFSKSWHRHWLPSYCLNTTSLPSVPLRPSSREPFPNRAIGLFWLMNEITNPTSDILHQTSDILHQTSDIIVS
jgi:hypothetical protein